MCTAWLDAFNGVAHHLAQNVDLAIVAAATLRHFYSGHPWLAPDIKERGIDELNPTWNMLDLIPQGRGTFYASLHYGTKVQAAKP